MKFTDGGERNTVPDFLGDALVYDRSIWPDLVKRGLFGEAKAKQGGLYLSSNTYQLKGHIDNLKVSQAANVHMYRSMGVDFRPSLYLFTTSDVPYPNSISEYATQQGVNFRHYTLIYHDNGNGTYNFMFHLGKL